MQDAWRAYLELALGVTEASRKRAEAVAREVAGDLLGRGEATAAQLQGAAEQLVATSWANREGLARLVRSEVDRALRVVGPAVGLATSDEVDELTARVRDLERRLSEPPAAAAGVPAPVVEPAAAMEPAAKKPAKKAVGKKAVGKKAVAKKAVAKKAVAKQAVAKQGTKKAGAAQGTAKTTAAKQNRTRGAEAGNR